MAEFLETQDEQEVLQVKSRELQLENTEKLNDILPVVENFNQVNLSQIEADTSDIKDIVTKNLDDQPDFTEVLDAVDKVSKSMSSLKGQITKLTKTITEMNEKLNEVDKDG